MDERTNREKTLTEIEKLLAEAKEFENKNLFDAQAGRFKEVGDKYLESGNLLEAMKYYKQAQEIYAAPDKANNPLYAALKSTLIAKTYSRAGQQSNVPDYYQKALDYYQKALDFYSKLAGNGAAGQSEYFSETEKTLWAMAEIYYEINNKHEALNRYKQLLTISAENAANNGLLGKSFAANAINEISGELNEFEETRSFYQEVLEKFKIKDGDKTKTEDEKTAARETIKNAEIELLTNISDSYAATNKQEAKRYLDKAAAALEPKKDETGRDNYDVYKVLEIARRYKEINEPAASLETLDKIKLNLTPEKMNDEISRQQHLQIADLYGSLGKREIASKIYQLIEISTAAAYSFRIGDIGEGGD